MFRNEPLIDFTIPERREALRKAIDSLTRELSVSPREVVPIIQGEPIRTGTLFERRDPSERKRVIAVSHMATAQHAAHAVQSVARGAAGWEATPATIRAEILRKAATIMRARREQLEALIILEAGKPWIEADKDLAEAVDFCDYYADQMLRLATPIKTMEVPGEDNFYFYEPRGVAAVISPWNFPLAIACGMTVAALVTGNTVVFKPAEQTTLIGQELVKILYEAGVPHSALAFLPGFGEEVGRALVEHPLTNIICFTGSKAVGLEIMASASRLAPGQTSLKRVIAELGGKNAIIVDEDADLDEAVKGVIYSVFGFSGQKCSACSRVIVVGNAYEPFMRRFTEATSDIISGSAADSSTLVGPVIDEESQIRILRTIAEGERTLSLAYKGPLPATGYFVPATIFQDVPEESPLWTEEIFGPVACCRPAANFEQAIQMANRSQYALTGGVFSRSPAHIALARRTFKVGNLYINRSCTGALVCRHPFGGFKLSGVGAKAGGPDYLRQFLEPRTVTENTMRRGFTPESK